MASLQHPSRAGLLCRVIFGVLERPRVPEQLAASCAEMKVEGREPEGRQTLGRTQSILSILLFENGYFTKKKKNKPTCCHASVAACNEPLYSATSVPQSLSPLRFYHSPT